jgi:hypothetical protein
MSNKLFLLADIAGNVMSLNPDHIETVGNPGKAGDVVTNDVTMVSGEVYTIPVQLIIMMLNNADYTVYDLITPKESADLSAENLDVNDTEYVDETPLEEVSDAIQVENYSDECDDGHAEFGEYITAADDLPDGNVIVDEVLEGSVANG